MHIKTLSIFKLINAIIKSNDIEAFRKKIYSINTKLPIIEKNLRSIHALRDYRKQFELTELNDSEIVYLFQILLDNPENYSFEDEIIAMMLVYDEKFLFDLKKYRGKILDVFAIMLTFDMIENLADLKKNKNDGSFEVYHQRNNRKLKVTFSSHFKNDRKHARKNSYHKCIQGLSLLLAQNGNVHLKVNKVYGLYLPLHRNPALIIFAVKEIPNFKDITVNVITSVSNDRTSAKELDGLFYLLKNPSSLLYIDSKYLPSDGYCINNGVIQLNDEGKKQKWVKLLSSEERSIRNHTTINPEFELDLTFQEFNDLDIINSDKNQLSEYMGRNNLISEVGQSI